MKLSRREIILLCVLLLAGSIYLFNQYAYQPLQQKTSTLIAENAKIQTTIEIQEAKMKTTANMQKEQERLEEEYRQLMIAVPEDAYIPEIIAWLGKSAKDASIQLDKVSYQSGNNDKQNSDQAKSDGVHACNFEISAAGSYFNLMSFLLKTENDPRIYVISGGQINAQQKKQEVAPVVSEVEGESIPAPEPLKGAAAYDSNNMVLKLKLSAYYDKDKALDISGMAEKVPPGEGRENPF
jgi:Tfp pilus assembly protein PilO